MPYAMPQSIDEIREGGKLALSRALSAIESAKDRDQLARLLDDAARHAHGFVLGLTGPPGVGKSTLTNALLKQWRAKGESVGVIAVDPSSQFTGGALLGDRTRLKTDPHDDKMFVRSMAARDRLGGLSEHAIAAIVLMRAIYDRVIVESVGIGQSEADISFAADAVVLCIQPGSGDSLQFMKAGVMELPDIIAVTKADMGKVARRARADVEGALTLSRFDAHGGRTPDVVMVSATDHVGMDDLEHAVDTFRAYLDANSLIERRRASQQEAWIREAIMTEHGRQGWAVVAAAALTTKEGPFATIQTLFGHLSRQQTL